MNTATAHPAPEDIMAFFDRELASDQAKLVSTHLDQCNECASVASTFQSISRSLDDWRVPSIPEKMAAHSYENARKIRSSMDDSKPNVFVRTSLWTWKQWTLGMGSAGALILLLVIGLFNGMYEHSMPQNRVSVDATANRPTVYGNYTPPPAPTQVSQLAAKLDGGGGGEAAPSYTPREPMIARTASVTLLVKDFAAARNSLDAILARHHAYAAELKASTVENAPRSLTAALRVPSGDLGPALVELKALGRVQEETQNGEEVTAQHIDLIARLKNSRETEQRLQAILAQRTGKMSDVLEVEQEISRVRGEIESMEGELKTLDRRVEFASINLILNEEYQASMSLPPLSAGSRLRNAIVDGFRNAGETILGILLFFAEYGLSLAIWLAILGLPIYWLRRRYRRNLASV